MAQVSVKEVKDLLFGTCDTVGRNKDGNIVIRRGYFYRNGMDSQKFAARVMEKLGDAVTLVECGDHWAPFRGGASVARGSHFYAVVKPV